jgi:uncharacterized phage-associated protein
MPQTVKKTLPEPALKRVKEVIREFLGQPEYEELFETRIQKLIFYTEVYCILHYERRLTEAQYRPYMFGAFSPDVRYALKKVDNVDKHRTIKNGSRTVAYSCNEKSSWLDDDSKQIIRRAHISTRSKSTDELAQFSKDSYLFENTEYDTPMKFAKFADALDGHTDVRSELLNQMPEKVDIESEDNLVPIDNVENQYSY